MTTCLILGGAACVWDDIAAYTGPVDGVVACNDIGADWPGELDAWVSLHPEKFRTAGWVAKREANGFPRAKRLFGYCTSVDRMRDEFRTPGLERLATDKTKELGSGSSGLFAAEVALDELGFDNGVLCGVPLSKMPHYFDEADWDQNRRFSKRWLKLPDDFKARLGSMSGWTREFLGGPDMEKATRKRKVKAPVPETRRDIREMRKPQLMALLEAHGITEEQVGDAWIETIRDMAERVVFTGL